MMVVVSTSTLASGFRLFNIINARGLPLSNSDLLKSENLSKIPETARQKYTSIWENIEEDIGSDSLEMLTGFVRNIYVKDRARKAIYEEFENKVFKSFPEFKGARFIEYVKIVSDIYQSKICECFLNSSDFARNVYFYNLVSIMRDFLPFNDWMSSLIKFHEKFQSDDQLFDFLKACEKKLAVEWINGLSFSERLTQVYKIIKLIDDSETPAQVFGNAIFDMAPAISDFLQSLESVNMYSKGRSRVSKYILLRIDMERSDMLHKKISFSGNITVEHILPQKPTSTYWTSRFDENQRARLTNKLGNLVLLNNRKNSSASNKNFPEKTVTYFAKKSDFDVTNELNDSNVYPDWNPEFLEKRHKKCVTRPLIFG